MNVILVGPPGSGKGTQAAELVGRFALRHLSTGDLLRAAVRGGSELGRRVAGILAAGELVPDALMTEIVAERLRALPDGWLLDGFPRTVPQAEALIALLDELGREPPAVIVLEVADEEIVRRLASRLVCADCGAVTSRAEAEAAGGPGRPLRCPRCDGERLASRDDDREETVRNRLGVFRDQTRPAAERLGRRYPLARVDGRGAPTDVAQRIAGALATAH
jgi:adenylate kinase